MLPANTQHQSTVPDIWSRALHYQNQRPTIVSTDFYVGTLGKVSALSEFTSAIELVERESLRPVQENFYECRFPYRVNLLRRLGKIQVNERVCPGLQNWRSQLKSDGATLVFASSFLGNPASSFGHSFIKLVGRDKWGAPRSDLLNVVVNYGANVTSSNPLSYAFNGLFGGFNGFYSIARYYEKLRDYNRIENRDLWEFDLNLSAHQIGDLIDHLWELRGAQKRYYFLDRNCAYEMMALLEAIEPNLQATERLNIIVTPTETLHALRREGQIKAVRFRYSQEKHINSRFDNLPPHEQVLVKQAVGHGQLSKAESSQMLDVILDVNLARAQGKQLGAEEQAFHQQVLKERSQKPQTTEKLPYLILETGPHKVSTNKSLFVGVGASGIHSGAVFGGRFAKKYFLEPHVDMDRFSELVFLDSRVFLGQRFFVQHLEALRVTSLPLSRPLLPHWSWRMSLGGEEQAGWSCERCFMSSLSADAGKHWLLTRELSFYSLVGAAAESERFQNQNFLLRAPSGLMLTLSPEIAMGMELVPSYSWRKSLGLKTILRGHFQLTNRSMLILNVTQSPYQLSTEADGSLEFGYRF